MKIIYPEWVIALKEFSQKPLLEVLEKPAEQQTEAEKERVKELQYSCKKAYLKMRKFLIQKEIRIYTDNSKVKA